MKDFLIVVTGLPGSGKTSIALPLSEQFEIPLLSKDLIKESLFNSQAKMPLKDIGKVAISRMYELAQQPGPAILDSFFSIGKAESDLKNIGKPILQIHCACSPTIAQTRYETRIENGDRHEVHQLTKPDWNEYAKHNFPLDLDGQLHIVNTETTFDFAEIVNAVNSFIEEL